VVLVGGSFVGERSVDIGEIHDLDPDAYYDIVSLWAADGTSEVEKRALVDESFTGAGLTPFTTDESVLSLIDPMRVDMCNIAFYQVHEEVPVPPATDTIGSDYFLIHLVPDSTLPGVVHNRHIVNFHTAERKSGSAFVQYHVRLAKFFLSMLYLHDIYQRMAVAGESLLDEQWHVRSVRIADLVRTSTWLDETSNVLRLDSLEQAYQKLGGRYAEFARIVAANRERWMSEARRDIEDFALLIEAWKPLVQASKAGGFDPAGLSRNRC
jgi:hypothetical protein